MGALERQVWRFLVALTLGVCALDWYDTGEANLLAAFVAAWGIGYGTGRIVREDTPPAKTEDKR